MDTKQLDALNAYGQAVKDIQSTQKSMAGSGSSEDASVFAEMITEQVEGASAAVANLETITAKAVAGLADPVDVVTAASNAEHMVNTVVSVRDKVIQSYNEILKMPI